MVDGAEGAALVDQSGLLDAQRVDLDDALCGRAALVPRDVEDVAAWALRHDVGLLLVPGHVVPDDVAAAVERGQAHVAELAELEEGDGMRRRADEHFELGSGEHLR